MHSRKKKMPEKTQKIRSSESLSQRNIWIFLAQMLIFMANTPTHYMLRSTGTEAMSFPTGRFPFKIYAGLTSLLQSGQTKTESHTVQPRKATASATLIPISVHLMIKRNSDYQLLSTASQRHRARILLILQILSTRLPTEKSIPFLPMESASAPLTAKEHVCQRLSATRQRQKISGA